MTEYIQLEEKLQLILDKIMKHNAEETQSANEQVEYMRQQYKKASDSGARYTVLDELYRNLQYAIDRVKTVAKKNEIALKYARLNSAFLLNQ